MHELTNRLSKDGSLHVTDEFYNTLISSVGALFTILGTFYLLNRAGNSLEYKCFFIYGTTLALTFLSSALHHGINGSAKTNETLRLIDYCAIFLAQAGSATPNCLLWMPRERGIPLLIAIWCVALLGITLKIIWPQIARLKIVLIYALTGTLLGLIIFTSVPSAAYPIVLLGGTLFAIGLTVYSFEIPNPFPGKFGFHEIWHVMALLGSSTQFYIVVKYLV